jgi:hypothetical protein
MKTAIHLLLPALLALAFSAFGQSVSISAHRVTYTRLHPKSEDKAQIIIDYPLIKASSRALSRKIRRSIGFSGVMKMDLRRELYGDEQWLEAAGFDVDMNKHGVLSVTLWASGTGQFWSSLSRRVVVDLKTGNRVTAGMVFTDLTGLAAVVKKHQDAEIARAGIDIPKTEGWSDLNTAALFETADITARNLSEFAVTGDGLVFNYDYGFPRLMRELQPPGVYVVPWSEAKPFIRRGGLLGKFVY